jgi:hypothetical protein
LSASHMVEIRSPHSSADSPLFRLAFLRRFQSCAGVWQIKRLWDRTRSASKLSILEFYHHSKPNLPFRHCSNAVNRIWSSIP